MQLLTNRLYAVHHELTLNTHQLNVERMKQHCQEAQYSLAPHTHYLTGQLTDEHRYTED